MADGPVKRVRDMQRAILAAVGDGRITPRSAVQYAYRAAQGEDISVLSQLTPLPGQKVSAATTAELSRQLVDILSQLVDGVSAPDPDADSGMEGLWPPGMLGHEEQANRGVYYEGGNPEPQPIQRLTPQGRGVSWDGYVNASGECSDDEADSLFPARNAEEARRHQQVRWARAAAVEPWGEEELHRILFGDTTGPEAG